MTNTGVLMGFIRKNGGRTGKRQCMDYLQMLKLPSKNINGLLSMSSNRNLLFYGDDEYIMTEQVIRVEMWLENFRHEVNKLFLYSLYVIPREIEQGWFELLPGLTGGLSWNLLLFQDLIKKHLPEYRLITANEDQGLDTIRAGIVPEQSTIEDFANLVYAKLLEDTCIKLPVRMNTEDFRKKLIEYKMIQGNELIYAMPKALHDSKYAWADDGKSVLILQK